MSSDDDSEFEGFVPDDLLVQGNVDRTFEMEQSANNRLFAQDTAIGWSENDSPVLNAPFTNVPGLNVQLPPNASAYDFFNLFWTQNMWDTLVTETNRYAQQRIAAGGDNLRPHSRLHKWTDVTLDEMKVFIALVINMGLVIKGDLQNYWTQDEETATPFFSQKMSKDRFLNILSNLHLVNNEDDTSDPLAKIRPFVTMLGSFSDVYTPERDLSLDEATCPFKGRCKFRVYNPQKPHKFGIKLFQVCESTSGYCVNFEIYQGADGTLLSDAAELIGVDQDSAQTTKTVVGLLGLSGLLNKGYRVYMDRYYTSPELFDHLDILDTYACGTVMSNRREVPVALRKGQIRLPEGEVIFRRRNNLLAVKFHDKRDVHFLSTFHQAEMHVLDRVDRQGQPVVKPTVVVDYVQKMGGVDTNDQIVQYYAGLRKTVKWWRKLFFHLLQLLVINALILFRKYALTGGCATHHAFRTQLVQAIIADAPNAPKPTPRGRKAAAPSERLTGRHFPSYIEAKEGAKRKRPLRDCKACNPKASRRDACKRRQTSFWCRPCGQVPLCVPTCFAVYHTRANYMRALRPEDCSSSEDSDTDTTDTSSSESESPSSESQSD